MEKTTLQEIFALVARAKTPAPADEVMDSVYRDMRDLSQFLVRIGAQTALEVLGQEINKSFMIRLTNSRLPDLLCAVSPFPGRNIVRLEYDGRSEFYRPEELKQELAKLIYAQLFPDDLARISQSDEYKAGLPGFLAPASP